MSRKKNTLVGKRVRAKTATMFGWKGTGVVSTDYDGLLQITADDGTGEKMYCAHEVAVCRNQTNRT